MMHKLTLRFLTLLFVTMMITLGVLHDAHHASAFTTQEQKLEQLTFSIALGSIQGDQGYGYFDFALQDGWKIYWRDPGEAGLPLSVESHDDSDIMNPDILWPAPYRFTDLNDMVSYGYSDHVQIPFTYKMKPGNTDATLHIELSGAYGICKTLCILKRFHETIVMDRKHRDSYQDEIITNLLKNLPQKISADPFKLMIQDQHLIIATADFKPPIKRVFIEAGEDFKFSAADIQQQSIHLPFVALNPESQLSEQSIRVTLVTPDQAFEFTSNTIGTLSDGTGRTHTVTTSNSIATSNSIVTMFYMLLLAFLGGLILNIMPCVLPVVSLKLGQIAQGSCQLSGKQQLLYTVIGMLCSFVILAALVILLKTLGTIVGWGFHFQQPVFVLVMLVILVAFTCSQLGLFHIRLKDSGKIHAVFQKLSVDSPLYHVFYGLIITLLATPCTAPFLGSAVGFALSQPGWVILLMFLSIAIGLAFPYIMLLLLPVSPKSLLPKPGNWLNYVRYFAAILLYASALWLLWVLAAQIGTLSAIILFVLINVLVLCSLRLGFTNLWRGLLVLVVLSPLYIPFQSLHHIKQGTELNWHPFHEAEIARQVAQDKIVFIDIGAEWCLTCKFNKIYTLSDRDVVAALAQDHVYLMRGDMTRPNQVLLDFIRQHERAGVPFNAVAYRIKNHKNEAQKSTTEHTFIVLPEILNKSDVIAYTRK